MRQTDAAAPKPTKAPCKTCPYRKDVPSGIWHQEEYAKLREYDGETWEQPMAVFHCHSSPECVCGGWLTAHDPQHLLALRLNRVSGECLAYEHDIPCFGSGAEAAHHGMKDLISPGPSAARAITRLSKTIGERNE